MNMPLILEQFIQKYFNKRLMPGIIEVYKKLQKKHGKAVAENPKAGVDFYIASFGYQTSFMMRYMAMAFGAVCIILLVLGLTVNPDSLMGLRIFLTFFVLCVLLWLITYKNSGYVVYTRDWLYVKRPGDFFAFAMDNLDSLKVKGKLALVFLENDGNKKTVEIPLESELYVNFVMFVEEHFPHVVAKIPEAEYDKAKRKHASAWSNRM